MAKTKALISFAVTAKLICVFVFAYAQCWFSHDPAHFRLIEDKPAGSHTVEVSVVEIYNNDIRDLLSGDPNAKHEISTGNDGSLNMPTLTSK